MAILQPGRNVWRIARAHRAAVLIDAARFFWALRKALLKAQHSVTIIGWDISRQTRLVGPNGTADDDWPETLIDFLVRLATERPSIEINILIWDYSLVYAGERELLPALSWGVSTPRQIRFQTDNNLPIGSSHHQKIITIDDSLAFTGGLDLTIRRWDTSKHRLDDELRVDPSGKPYRPFHDVQMMVDGAAAQALAALAQSRWDGTHEPRISPKAPSRDVWPDEIAPDFSEVNVGISRTIPFHDDHPEIREVETLFHDAIEAATRTLYIENQFLTSSAVADHLIARLRERPELEALLVTSTTHDSWLEAHTMRPAMARFMSHLLAPDICGRVRIACPIVSKGTHEVPTTVHSKIMLVDDKFLRVGSANLNNRSMGVDTECDLSIETPGSEAILRIRDKLIADHCGVRAEDVAAAVADTGSMIRAADSLSAHGHRLRPVAAESAVDRPVGAIEFLADPARPLQAEELIGAILGDKPYRLHTSKLMKLCALAGFIVLLFLVWSYAPLEHIADPEFIREKMRAFADSWFAPALAVGSFLVLQFVAFPITLLIAVTAAAFGPWLGLLYATAGILLSAAATYGIGLLLGKNLFANLLATKTKRLRRVLNQGGVLTIAAVRLVPIAPFAVVNVTAGALQVRFIDFIAGTLIGIAPGLLLMSALGHQILTIFAEPTFFAVGMLLLAFVAWIGVAVAAQAAVTKYRERLQ